MTLSPTTGVATTVMASTTDRTFGSRTLASRYAPPLVPNIPTCVAAVPTDSLMCGCASSGEPQVAPGIKFDWNTFSEVEGAVNVRGCAYEHTAKRELLMAGLVDNALRPLNFNCGLIPAALWTYNIPEAPFPLVRAPTSDALPCTCRHKHEAQVCTASSRTPLVL